MATMSHLLNVVPMQLLKVDTASSFNFSLGLRLTHLLRILQLVFANVTSVLATAVSMDLIGFQVLWMIEMA